MVTANVNPTNVCQWMPLNEYGQPRLRINDKEYDLVTVNPFMVELAYLSPEWEMVCYRVVRRERDGELIACSCPSAMKGGHQGFCKHVRALRAALKKPSYPVE